MLIYIAIKEKGNPKKIFKMMKAYHKIKKYNLFDKSYYLEKYPNIAKSNIDPLDHYIYQGYNEKKNPSELFDGNYYLDKNEDVKKTKQNPLIHYVLHGKKEGRQPYGKDDLNITDDNLVKNKIFNGTSLNIGFIVTESLENPRAGDVFTALELGGELEKLNHNVTYIPRNEEYDGSDLDIIINLLHDYDISKIYLKNSCIKIAWMRNWFIKWINTPEIENYDLYLASSKTACDYLNEHLDDEVFLLPIATNIQRFSPKKKEKKYESDYCFTGNYWGCKRDIIKFLNPKSLPYTFKIYGIGWNNIAKFRKYIWDDEGFLDYKELPKVYSSTKVVIDDANHVTKPYGAINSRVFDAIANGTLVITNGVIGSEETFKGLLPSFNSKEELERLLNFYLSNEKERLNKIKELKNFVIKNHTYEIRSLNLLKIIKDNYSKVFEKQEKNAKIIKSQYDIIKNSGKFNENWYLNRYSEVKKMELDPILHYLKHGFKKGYNPSPGFNTKYYMKLYPDIKRSELNPFIHYITHGYKEYRLPKILTLKEQNRTINRLINENKKQIRLKNFSKDSPLVSIIILNRNGADHLKRLFSNFKENICYPNYEVIVVDNNSTDESIEVLNNLDIPITIIKNKKNESFSTGNNKAVNYCKGEFLLFLNNDIETTYGWLNIMMQTSVKNKHRGAVGAKLIYPYIKNKKFRSRSFKIQHAGVFFRELKNGFMEPYHYKRFIDPFNEKINKDYIISTVTGAVLLVKKSLFKEVDGFDENFDYGYEDVDFCIKLIKKGYCNVYSHGSLLFHHENETDTMMNSYLERSYRMMHNRAILSSKHDEWLLKKVMDNKLNKENVFTESRLNIIFLIKSEKDKFKLEKLVDYLNKYGWKTEIRDINTVDAYDINIWADVLISTVSNYYPNELLNSRKNLIKLALIIDNKDNWENSHGLHQYDSILTDKKSINENIISLEPEKFMSFLKNEILDIYR
ncbi:glycosyltransferase [Methanobrevibacter filiformis]|nr:glycosyltransferase [Methanobrevibacter filiformis]